MAARTLKALEPEGWRGGVEEALGGDLAKIQTDMMALAQKMATNQAKFDRK